MFTHRFTHLTSPIKALLIVMLCGVIAASVSADGKDNRSSERDSGKSDAKQEAGAKDGRDGKNNRGNRHDSPSIRPESPRGSVTNQPGAPWGNSTDRKGHWGFGNQQRGDNRRPDNSKPMDSYRPGQRPSTNNSQPNGWLNRNNNWGNRPNFGSRPTTDNHNYNSPAKKYEPPTNCRGSDYYSSRPNYKPLNYSYWSFEYNSKSSRKSVYFHFGYLPYMQLARIHIAPYITVSYRSTSVVIDNNYYLSGRNNSGLDYALADIRGAWMDRRYDLISNHVSMGQRIAIMLDGRYDYSVDSEDYVQMTSDAVDQIQTVSFTWNSIRQRIDGDYTAFASHTYYDTYGTAKTVYVSYTLSRIGSDYDIVEVGSSSSRLSY